MAREAHTLFEMYQATCDRLEELDSDDDVTDREYGMVLGMVLVLLKRLEAARGENQTQEELREDMISTLIDMRERLVVTYDARADEIYLVEGRQNARYEKALLALMGSGAVLEETFRVQGTEPVALAYARQRGMARHALHMLAALEESRPEDKGPTLAQMRAAAKQLVETLDAAWVAMVDALLFGQRADVTLPDLYHVGFGDWGGPRVGGEPEAAN